METIDEKLAIRFLLGDLPEERRLKLEERFFADDQFYEQLLAIQEELADDYVQNRLTSLERAQFESSFLTSPRRRERVEFAAAFSQALSGTATLAAAQPASTSWWESLLAIAHPRSARIALFAGATALALLAGSTWLLVENRRLSHRVQEARAERDILIQRSGSVASRAKAGLQQVESVPAPARIPGETTARPEGREQETVRSARSSVDSAPGSGAIALLILSPGVTRGEDETSRLTIAEGTRSVQVQLDLDREEDYGSYAAEIRTARGTSVWSNRGLEAKRTGYGHAVHLEIPAGLIAGGEYEVELQGAAGGKLEPMAWYYFTAVRQ